MTPTHVQIILTNETDGYRFSEYEEELSWPWVDDDGTIDRGRIFREARSEYGACRSSVYVDTEDGPAKVGWFFVSRQQYEDTGEPYLRGAWVTLVHVEPRTVRPVALP